MSLQTVKTVLVILVVLGLWLSLGAICGSFGIWVVSQISWQLYLLVLQVDLGTLALGIAALVVLGPPAAVILLWVVLYWW